MTKKSNMTTDLVIQKINKIPKICNSRQQYFFINQCFIMIFKRKQSSEKKVFNMKFVFSPVDTL